jgi:8-oxo-dGTP pyrophosphatase MutT (NUDIX family)
MRRLLTLDEDNYTQDMPVYERWNVRAVIFRDGKLAMERSRAGEYKFPGGSVDAGESRCDALCREVREEMGLIVLPSSIHPLGEILEKREDLFQKGSVYLCHSLYFRCDVEEETVPLHLTESEVRQGQQPCWAEPEHILKENQSFFHKPWLKRDTEFLKLWMKDMAAAEV